MHSLGKDETTALGNAIIKMTDFSFSSFLNICRRLLVLMFIYLPIDMR